jgi:single-stranded DNA-specific DHH superfamily exonuclease
MIKKKQIKEIKELLLQAKNPLFIFDHDPDGLSSFLILRRFINKGSWFSFTHNEKVSHQLLGKVEEQAPDLIILLDMAVINQEFADKISVPIIHIDHHAPINIKGKHYHYYNPRVNKDSDNRPTTHWAYQIAKQDQWIAAVGIISDWFIPDDHIEINKKYPDLLPKKIKSPGFAYFETEMGRLAQIFYFALSGKKEETIKCIQALLKVKSPYDILRQETPQGRLVYRYADKRCKKFNKMFQDAIEQKTKNKLFIYTYSYTKDSFSSLLSNKLIYMLPKKIIIVARVKEEVTIMSLRSKEIPIVNILLDALEGLDGFGGGHPHACGSKINNDDFPIFIERFKESLKKVK